jgi:EAL domain-containing protein (putative c-di-GMP-specific phosphodiesterase class I)
MNALIARGVCFALDDFGTGFSSLSSLRRLPLDRLKIDQSFVARVLTDSSEATIAKTIVAMAGSLNMGVIAEGVETQGQRDFLAASGCQSFQGFLFGQPKPVELLG